TVGAPENHRRVTTVQTALGPVEAAKLGRVLMHEHVFVMTADVQQNYPEEWGDEDQRVADAVRKLSELPKHGIDTIVDVTVVGQGRDIARIKRIAEQVPDLNIVVATGIYTFDEVPLFFSRRPKETMTDFFIRDITEGIAGTGVRAGRPRPRRPRPQRRRRRPPRLPRGDGQDRPRPGHGPLRHRPFRHLQAA